LWEASSVSPLFRFHITLLSYHTVSDISIVSLFGILDYVKIGEKDAADRKGLEKQKGEYKKITFAG